MLGPADEVQLPLDGNYATADMEMDVVSVGQGGRLCLGRRTGSLLSRPEFSSYRVGIGNLGPTPGYLKMVFLFFGWDPFLGGFLWRSRVQVAPGGNYATEDMEMDMVSVGQGSRRALM